MRLTWWGHSTVTIADGDTSLLTDPVLGNRLGHLRRRAGLTPPPSVCNVDAVIVSHLHADHLDIASLRRMDPRAVLIVPHGGKGVLRHRAPSLAARCMEVAPGEAIQVGKLLVRATPAAHPGARGPWSRHQGQALGYIVSSGSRDKQTRVWFAGDTGLGAFMSQLGQIEAALIPVGGWGLTLGEEHLNPERAVEALRLVAPQLAVPIHYGTLWPIGAERLRPDLFAPPGLDFARLAGRAGLATEVSVLKQGESVDVVPHLGGAGSFARRKIA